ncbi:MAG: phosphoesterase [Planctomycetia bacterium]|nr:phosphoesterase [Planctomycetia bacterium]
MKNESILVIPTEYFRQLGYFQGFTKDISRYIPQILEASVVRFMPRPEAELDPNWKQLIPYMIFSWRDETGREHLFRYTRGKGMGETRLHLKHSVGVGGHLSEDDCSAATTLGEAYREGMRRERSEEVRIETQILSEKIVGLINDDETEVGRVHLGVVHWIEVAEPKVYSNETDLYAAGFYPLDELLQDLDGYETWSSITLKTLYS